MKRKLTSLLLLITTLLSLLASCFSPEPIISLDDIPEYAGAPYIKINDNVPFFTEDEITAVAFESYSPLDALGRCGVAVASIGVEIMPTEDRGEINSITPSGWKYNGKSNNKEYNGEYLYNRCHLIGFQLTGENANKRNLITGTRYLNVDGMLPFENMVADYIKETGNHVLYRVTPVFEGNELVARGVQMEALSVEDDGDGICFNVYCYNNQPGVKIDYATGDNEAFADDPALNYGAQNSGTECDYVLNTNSKKIHLPQCSAAKSISDYNREEYCGTKDELLNRGYSGCCLCNP